MTIRNTRLLIAATALGIVGSTAVAAEPPALNHGGEQAHTLLAFHSMYGVDGPFVGNINDEPTFRAAVSCTTEKGDSVVRRKVITEPFPATRTGDSRIRATVELPNPCVAPTVLILAGSEDKWFAVVGFESEEEEE